MHRQRLVATLVTALACGFLSGCTGGDANPGDDASNSETANADPNTNQTTSDETSSDISSDTTSEATGGGDTMPNGTVGDGSNSGSNSDEQSDLRKQVAEIAIENPLTGGWQANTELVAQLQATGEDSIERVKPLLGDEDVAVRRGAAYYLLPVCDGQDAELANAFQQRLSDEDSAIRHIALQAIKQLPDDMKASAAGDLAKLLSPDSASKTIRGEVARLLGGLEARAADSLPKLAEAAKTDPESQVRIACMFAATKIGGDAEGVKLYAHALSNDEEPGVRAVSAVRLGRLPPSEESAAALGTALDDEDTVVAENAAKALAQFGEAAVAPAVAKLTSARGDTRYLAVYVLFTIGPVAKPALPELKKRLQDEDQRVREAAQGTINRLEATP